MTQYRATLNGEPITEWKKYMTVAIIDADKHGYDIDAIEVEMRTEPEAATDCKMGNDTNPFDLVGGCFEAMGLK